MRHFFRRRFERRVSALLPYACTFLLLLLALPAQAQDFPELTGRVVDAADILPPDTEVALTAKLAALETQSQRQLVVATVPDLEDYDIADYGYRLGRAWELGDAERDDGLLLLVAPNDRKVRIEVGYGLEGIVTDALSSVIIQQAILPRFRDGDMPGGVVAGADALIAQLQLPEDEARQVASGATQQRARDGATPVGVVGWFVALVFFFFVLPAMFGGKRKRRYRGKGRGRGGLTGAGTVGDIILWELGSAVVRGALSGGGGGGSSGGFGSGGFGGGGFSGGGGSFGGGGASGGW